MKVKKKFLFIPVSSTKGIGEYMRSLIIADEIKKTWPDSEIRFVLNRQANYADKCPYPADLLKDTPTKQVKAVNDILEKYRPNFAIFDASGRQSQLKKAKQIGAHVVFISQHEKKRRRGMKWGRAKLTDLHFVVQPWFVMPEVGRINQLKLKLLGKSEPECIGAVYTPPNQQKQQQILTRLQLKQNEFVLFSSGSGGHRIEQQLAADIFYLQAKELFHNTGIKTVIVMGPNYPKAIAHNDEFICLPSIDNSDFINLLVASKAAVLSGGDALLQSISLGIPTLACPVSKDQPARIEVCKKLDLIVSANAQELANGIKYLLQENTMEALATKMKQSSSTNGIHIFIKQITNLMTN
ncbi:hypothetical protein D5R81_03580 [Parashewanella spongiae]|uniref:Glycosyltransferase n=1 Tax=Parashewanella spongiae TaxID=342950 RepID=A0A3A6UIE3_9GAMM|nr:hypothetical protein [Parashewanella spongiae]MCL1077132.1 hypothetical protein [Parashewanella spongiae]RJY18845.1 hypothetical protein D5R81_03580 [Parashewanella spongiae]